MCVCVFYGGVGVTMIDNEKPTTVDADITYIAAAVGGVVGGLLVVMAATIGVVILMIKKRSKHG